MIRSETMDIGRPQRVFPLHDPSLLAGNYVTHSPNNGTNVPVNRCSTEHNPARDSGVDLQEPKDNHAGKQNESELSVALGTPVPLSYECSVSNPIISGSKSIKLGNMENSSSSDAQAPRVAIQSNVRETYVWEEERRFLFASETSETISSVNTASTVLEEEPFSFEKTTSENFFLFDASDPIIEARNCDSDDEPYIPEDEKEEEEGNIEIPSTDMHMENSVYNINDSEVQFGPTYNIALPSLTKNTRDLNISAASELHMKESATSTAQGLQININTPPVQTVPLHFPVGKTQSTPVRSPSSPRFPLPLNIPLTTQMPQPCAINSATLNPSPSPGNIHIGGGNVVLGTQIVFNSPQNVCSVFFSFSFLVVFSDTKLLISFIRLIYECIFLIAFLS